PAPHAPPRRPNARAADFAEIGSIALGQSPFVVVLRDVGAGCDTEVKVNLAHEIEQVTMAVDQTRENRFAFRVDDTGITGQSDFAVFADGFDALAFDDDGGVFDRRPAGGVDEGTALDD